MQNKNEIAPGHKGIGDSFGGAAVYGHVRGQRIVGQLMKEIDAEQGVRAEALFPVRTQGGDCLPDIGAALQLYGMTLAVVKADGLHRGKAGQGPGKTGGRILPSRKNDQSRLFAQGRFRLMDTGAHENLRGN